MKKMICFVLAMVVMASLSSPVVAVLNPQLSSLSDAEIMNFLNNQGIDVPALDSDEMSWMTFIRYVISEVEEDACREFVYGYTIAQIFANEIKTAVNAYYGRAEIQQYAGTRSSAGLQDSVVVPDGWQDEYLEYNCLGYAVDYFDFVYPGEICWRNSGNDENHFTYNWYANIYTVAQWIKDDLESMGYTVANPTTVIPATIIDAHTRLICVRIDTDGDQFYGFRDFHLMKLDEDGYWYHKPGRTIPLRYKYVPTNDRIWLDEFVGSNGYDIDADCTYDSEIYFIEYTTAHEYEYESRGGGQHILTCTICGATSGSVINCVYVHDYCVQCYSHNHTLTGTAATGNNYHEGSKHYYEYRSVCPGCGDSFYSWKAQLCSGPPCNVIMGIEDKEEALK